MSISERALHGMPEMVVISKADNASQAELKALPTGCSRTPFILNVSGLTGRYAHV